MSEEAPAKLNRKRTYSLLYTAQQDLSQAAFFADYLRTKKWCFEPWEVPWPEYFHQAAYVTSMVVSYSRPFTESRGWPKFPKRILRVLDPDQKQLHQRLLDLRNEVYAHTDVAARKIRPITLGGRPSAIEVTPPLRFEPAELKDIRHLIRAICLEIEQKLQSLSEAVVTQHYDEDGNPKET